MLHLLTPLILLFSQTERVQFQMTNTSNDPIVVETPGFRSVTIIQDKVSDLSFHPGQEVFAIQDVDDDEELDRVFLFVVDPSYSGRLVKVDKELKKATKVYLSER